MNRKEALEIVKRVKASYQNFQCDDMKLTADIWYSVLENANYDKASLALLEYVREGNEFAPTAGQLFKMANAMLEAERAVERDPSEAFRNGYKCKYCKDMGIVIKRLGKKSITFNVAAHKDIFGNHVPAGSKTYEYYDEVAQICGICNQSAAEALQKGGYRNDKEWVPLAKQNVIVAYPSDDFKKVVGETPFD